MGGSNSPFQRNLINFPSQQTKVFGIYASTQCYDNMSDSGMPASFALLSLPPASITLLNFSYRALGWGVGIAPLCLLPQRVKPPDAKTISQQATFVPHQRPKQNDEFELLTLPQERVELKRFKLKDC